MKSIPFFKKLSLYTMMLVTAILFVPSKVYAAPATARGVYSELSIRPSSTSGWSELWRCDTNATQTDPDLSPTFQGATYNAATNTLTLSNVTFSNLYCVNMGSDFKINLIGTNKVNVLFAEAGSESTNGLTIHGSSFTFMGTGTLETNQIYIEAFTTDSRITLTGSVEIKITKNQNYIMLGVSGTSNKTAASAINAGLTESDFRTTTVSVSGYTAYEHEYTEAKTQLEIQGPDHIKRRTNIASTDVTVSPTSYTYSGTAKQPSVTVKYNGSPLAYGRDYTVSYANNINVGKGVVTVTGIGKYYGAKQVTFTIKQASVQFKNTLKEIKKTKVAKKKQTFSIIKKSDGGKVTYKVKKGKKKYISVSKDGKVTVKKGAPSGVYKIAVTVAKKGNYKKTKKTVTVIVS